jgi:hypothetical protein
LQLDTLAVEVYCADFEIDADGCDERGGKAIFGKAEEAAGLADARVAY